MVITEVHFSLQVPHKGTFVTMWRTIIMCHISHCTDRPHSDNSTVHILLGPTTYSEIYGHYT